MPKECDDYTVGGIPTHDNFIISNALNNYFKSVFLAPTPHYRSSKLVNVDNRTSLGPNNITNRGLKNALNIYRRSSMSYLRFFTGKHTVRRFELRPP